MINTNRLLRIRSEEVSGSDLLPLWSQRYGGLVALSLTELQEWLSSSDSSGLTTQYAAPSTTPATVIVSAGDTWLLMTPTTAIANMTIILPAPALLSDGAEVLITTTQQITSMVFDGNGASGVFGVPSSLGAGDPVRVKYDAQSFTWYRVSGD